MACFFKHQNHSRGGKYPKVFLNITSIGCDFSFMAPDGQDYSEVTAKDFFLAKEKVLNYAYAGGEHPCNYSMTRVRSGNLITFTFTLNQVTSVSLGRTYMDYAAAIFKQGSPVLKVVIVYSSAGSLISSKFESLEDMNNQGLIPNPSTIECHSVSDASSTDYQLPALKVGNILTRATTDDIRASQSGYLFGIPTMGYRVNTDDVGGTTRVTPLAWFMSFPDSQEDIFAFIMVTPAGNEFDMNAHQLKSWQYKAWSDEWNDNACSETAVTDYHYRETFE